MRIRRKKWAKDELERSKFYIDKPDGYKGKWKEMFKSEQPIHIELGCGKGMFISSLASKNQNVNYIAVDMIEAMLGLSKRNIEEAYINANLVEDTENIKPNNLWLIRANVEHIENVFSKEDEIERIYINFCNPWPKAKHNKRRLTHPRQLEQYKTFLKDGGEIYFKTDDDELFTASLDYFEEAGFKIINKTLDLHSEDIFEGNIETEHEKMFTERGINIKALIAQKTNY